MKKKEVAEALCVAEYLREYPEDVYGANLVTDNNHHVYNLILDKPEEGIYVKLIIDLDRNVKSKKRD